MGYILVGTVIGGIIWGIVVNKVIENKGYEENWFWWGFFFGIFALIIALTKQSVNTTKVVIESSAPIKENMELLSSCALKNQVNISSPIHIASWEIKKDAEKLVLFVDFINVSRKEISAVMFSATSFNSFGDIVRVNDADLFDVMGQDLSIKPNECGKVYTTLQDNAIRKVKIKVKKICFADGTIADDFQEEWINTNQLELNSIHIDCARRENEQSKYYSLIKEHYWQCVCGFVNTQNTCAICGMQKDNASKFTQDNFDNTYSEYLKQIEVERLDAERRLKEGEKRTKARKTTVTIITSTILFSIIAGNLLKFIIDINYKNNMEYLRNSYEKFNNLICTGYSHTVGLKSDGTVVATGDNRDGECNVTNWTNIVAVSAGSSYTIGLKSDGTVVAVGDNVYGECDVSNWSDIIAFSTAGTTTVGLKSNGRVVAVGNNDNGQCEVSEWSDIISISAGGLRTVGLKSNGTVVAVGYSADCNITDWENIVGVSTGSYHTVGLKSDGTVVATGDNRDGRCDVSNWADIVAVSAGGNYTIGLKSDGTVVATGDNRDGRCDVSNWTDIVAVSAGGNYTIGLKSDGTVVATGDNRNGRCDVSNWDLLD